MGKLMILNGSPRAPQSNSKQYASIFRSYYKEDIIEYHITPRNHEEILSAWRAVRICCLFSPSTLTVSRSPCTTS